MKVKYVADIIKEIQARGSIEVPKGYITGEAFEEWLREGKEDFEMNISEQVNELREIVENKEGNIKVFSEIFGDLYELLNYAADTIEALSTKLQAVNTENDGGWILCKDRLPITSEYMELEPTPYMKRLEIAYMTDTVEYLIGFYDGSKWIGKHHNIIKNVIAWKPFVKLPEPYRP